MAIKMILCDLDGTLYNSDKVVSDYTIDVIKKARAQGIIFGVASGRATSFIRQHFTQLGLNDLIDVVVGDGGGSIDDTLIDIDHPFHLLSAKATKRIMKQFEGFPVVFGVPADNKLIVSKDSPIIHHVTGINKYPFEVCGFDELTQHDIAKLCVFCMEKDLDMIEAHANTFSVADCDGYFVRSGPYLIEYANTHVTKQEGIAALLEAHHLSLDELMVFGDADNDYGMIDYAHYGIVMANGSEKTKSVAYDLTLDNDHDGVAYYIEHYVLNHS